MCDVQSARKRPSAAIIRRNARRNITRRIDSYIFIFNRVTPAIQILQLLRPVLRPRFMQCCNIKSSAHIVYNEFAQLFANCIRDVVASF